MNEKILKMTPAVFIVGDTYQIMVPVKKPCVMWVKVGNECFYDDSNGILKSDVTTHRMTVPYNLLNNEKKYTICYREMLERKPYFSETGDITEVEFSFKPVPEKNAKAYQIADAHNMSDCTVKAMETYEKNFGKIDFLILNGDIPDNSDCVERFDTIYEIIESATNGNIPVIFSRGNHDTRGICAEKIAEHTPVENGNSYFTFKLGDIWGLVLDFGEDKYDKNPEYGNTICCEAFRKRETEFIKKIIENKENEYLAPGVKHVVVVAHNPFTRQYEFPFDVSEDICKEWSKLLKDHIKPEIMICGHKHCLEINPVGGKRDYHGQPCTVIVGSLPKNDLDVTKRYFAGCGFEFNEDEIIVKFTDSNGEILEVPTI